MKNIYKIIIGLVILTPTVVFGAITPTGINQGNGFINPIRIGDRIEASSFIASSTSASSLFYGLVGIGTSTPVVSLDILSTTGSALSVTGGIAGTTIAQFSRRAGAVADIIMNGSGGDPQIVFSVNNNALFSTGVDNNQYKISGSGVLGTNDIFTVNTTPPYIQLALNNLEMARFTPTGAGFGTTTPRWPVQVAATTTPQLVLTSNGTTESHWGFRNAGGNLYLASINPTTFATSTTPSLSFSPTLSQVGVGTSTFAGGVELTLAGGTNPVPLLLDSTSASGMYTIFRNSSRDFGYIGSGASLFTSSGGALTDFSIRASQILSLGVGAGEDMRIAATGFVGIGTSSPMAPLSVVGFGGIVTPNITATSTTATSTFAGGVDFRNATVQQKLALKFGIATTTAWTGTTTRQLGPMTTLQTWSSATCYTTVGTLNVVFSDGTNSTNMIQASTTPATFAITTNRRFVAGSKSQVSVGTPASSPTEISCTIDYISNI